MEHTDTDPLLTATAKAFAALLIALERQPGIKAGTLGADFFMALPRHADATHTERALYQAIDRLLGERDTR